MQRIIFVALLPLLTVAFAVLTTTALARQEESSQPSRSQPMSVAEATAIFDARKFPAPKQTAPESHSTPISAQYMVLMDQQEAFPLVQKAWKELGFSVDEINEDQGKPIGLSLSKQGLRITCSVHEQDKGLTSIFIMLLGNVDLRELDKAAADSIEFDQASFQGYRSTNDIDQVIDFYRTQMSNRGWVPYQSFHEGFADPERREISFINRGMRLGLFATKADAGAKVVVSVGLQERDMPIPPGADNLKLDVSGFALSCYSNQSVPELLAFFRPQIKAAGRSIWHGRQFGDQKAAMLLTHPQESPVFLELVHPSDGRTYVYMARPTRQVMSATKAPPRFEIDYEKAMPLDKTHLHTVHFDQIPFLQPEAEGSGRTVAESVFYNTRQTRGAIIDYYRKFFEPLGWQVAAPEEKFIGDKLFEVIVHYQSADARIEMRLRDWTDDTTRVVIQGNGIQWPGDSFCQMLARPEAEDINE